ncbi:VOC family protein [Oerskovia flava]|uniref:VOC family protein n=1 Tax=Oerskovia flava TaxID=2986422 RepID=UPI0022408E91|nr:VOC family protein [Oerskovia sp. JB1-3-2]
MITSIYPVLMTADVAASARYFVDVFGFESVFDSDWCVSLRRDAWELALLDAEHTTIPAGYRTPAAGVLLNIEVEDADSEYRRLSARDDTELALDIRSEEFGQRHFIVVAPGGVLVDVIQPIPYTGAFADQPS